MANELEGKVVIVTGGAGRIGSVCALHMAREGAAVVVSDRKGAPIQAVIDEITRAGGRAVGHEGEASEEPDNKAMVQTAVDAFGRLDGLVNTVATVRDSNRVLDQVEVAEWDHIMAVNVRGPMLASKYAIPVMQQNGGGSIVNFTSPNGFYGDLSRIAYSTSKAAIAGLTKSVATAYGKEGIRCNAIAPNTIWDPETKAKFGPEFIDVMERTLLTPRTGHPDDIAHMVVFLLSEKTEFITGQILYIDGGASSHMPWVRMK